MQKNHPTYIRPLVAALLICYLGLLGYHHQKENRSPIEVEDILVSQEARRQIPEPVLRAVVSEQPAEPVAIEKPVATIKPAPRFKPGTLPELAPSDLTGKERYQYYRELAEHYGMSVNQISVLGFRGLSPQGERHPSGDNASDYDDTFVILHPEREEATEYLGSTHAGQPTSTLSPGGVAQLKAGVYNAVPAGEYADMPCWLVTTPRGVEEVPCWRDADGSGFIESWEKIPGLTATEILFHNGRYAQYGSSIGCQVLPPNLMSQFIEDVGVYNSFQYLLLDANRAS